MVALAGVVWLWSLTGCAVQAQVGDDPYAGSGDEGGDPSEGQYGDRPGYDESAEAGDYRRGLDPYGDWVDDRSYGRVWRPRVAADWSPYSDGSWGWTHWGWTWIGGGPWAWTFHYGRWVYAQSFGWSWYPGTVWGPAWVDWNWSNGWVGWAPLAPFGIVSVNHYYFVNERDFCSPHLRRVIVREHDAPDFVRRGVYDRRIVRPPDHDHIQRVARDPIRRFDHGPGAEGGRQIVRPGSDFGGRRIERSDNGHITDDRPLRRIERPGRSFGDVPPGRVARPGWGDQDRPERRIERREDAPRPHLERNGGYRTPDGGPMVERHIRRDAGGDQPADDSPRRVRRFEHDRGGSEPPTPYTTQMPRVDHGPRGEYRAAPSRIIERAPIAAPPSAAGPFRPSGGEGGGGHGRAHGGDGDDDRHGGRMIIRR